MLQKIRNLWQLKFVFFLQRQESLSEGEGSVRLTSSLRQLVSKIVTNVSIIKKELMQSS
jgi:hypothetical protein